MLTCVCAMQNVAEASKFKDFWRANRAQAIPGIGIHEEDCRQHSK